ncbi:ATP-binding protein [Paenibacillus sp. JX-17]|uniref:histidine kinase n=1 Tax=Paenibacillus lacisoli TaxID=3064525 RepID=A0ABT9CBP1_9BACL|nr:ATP-binding protein [Paenibacillus sp. JX-17]MDO7906679.1 ATP-binding protein [Paenibacillus sp. JX-17]
MHFSKMFLMNLGMLITVAYLANLFYKYTLSRLSARVKYSLSVLLMIFGGWISSFFGFQLSENVIFDLRIVPLIIAILAYSRSYYILIIGVGIGLTRFTFGISQAAFAGFINLAILGVIGMLLNEWLRRSDYRLMIKVMITILTVNLINTVNIALFGVITAHEYLTAIVPYTLPLSIVLCFAFALMLRDFQLDQRRMYEIESANARLSEQTLELQKAKIVLEERAKQLMLASQYKSEFMANMSHELRTPLNGIINLAQMIMESGQELSEDELKQYGEIMYGSGHDLLLLINDILDLSKVEAGKLEIVQEDVNVSETLLVLISHFELEAAKKGLELELEEQPGLPELIYSDPKRLQQILRNLLSNALKFTHNGRVRVKAHLEKELRSGQKGNWIVFSVEDTGIGIPPHKQHVIFEAFQQADGTISRRYGGTGLGLSISRDLARLLGGFILLKSTEGQGSTFSLYLPV